MSDLMTRAAGATYAPPRSKADVLAEALGAIVSGRPLPEHLRPAPVTAAAPATVEEGIARMLGGPSTR